MRLSTTLTAILLVTSTMLAGPTLAGDDTVTVCQDGSCDQGTIQAGVNNADPGDTVLVKDGPYTEQVFIDKTIDLVTDTGSTIEAPSALEADDDGRNNLITIAGDGIEVLVSGFTLTGPVKGLDSGIQVKDGAFAHVAGNEILAIRDDPLSGAQRGVGVTVGPMWTDDGTPGQAVVEDNVIRDFQKSAVTVTIEGSQATIADNDIDCSGSAADDTIAQDAIQIWQSGSAEILGNTIDNCYQFFSSEDRAKGVGIHLSNGAHDVRIADNEITGAQTSVMALNYFFAAGPDERVEDVTIESNTIDGGEDGDGGVYLAGSGTDVTVRDNTVTNQDVLGVFVGPDFYIDAPDFQDVEIDNNTIVENDAPGLFVRESANNVTAHFNQIVDNDVGALNLDDANLDASHNWWGSPAGPTLNETTSPVTGDSVEGSIAFAPFCVDADCEANEQVHGSPAPHVAAPPTAVPPSAP